MQETPIAAARLVYTYDYYLDDEYKWDLLLRALATSSEFLVRVSLNVS